MAVCVSPAVAQCPEQWLDGHGLAGFSSYVYAATTWDPDGAGPKPPVLVVGGSFTIAGKTVANRIAFWDGAAWQPLGSGMNNEVYALGTWDPDGAGPKPELLIAGGAFTQAGALTCNRIARWDGATWQPLKTGMNGAVNALSVFGNRLIAGGDFTNAGGAAAAYIARWDGGSWQPVAETLRWNLHPGSNRLEVRTVNQFGVAGPISTVESLVATGAASAASDKYPFFPFCIDWHDAKKRSFEQQAQMLKELGYPGVGHIWLDNVEERIRTLDAAGLKLFQITMTVEVAPGKVPYDAAGSEASATPSEGEVCSSACFSMA